MGFEEYMKFRGDAIRLCHNLNVETLDRFNKVNSKFDWVNNVVYVLDFKITTENFEDSDVIVHTPSKDRVVFSCGDWLRNEENAMKYILDHFPSGFSYVPNGFWKCHYGIEMSVTDSTIYIGTSKILLFYDDSGTMMGLYNAVEAVEDLILTVLGSK